MTAPDATATPYDAYLSRLSRTSASTMAGCLDRLAVLLAPGTPPTRGVGRTVDWWQLTVAEVVALRGVIADQGWAPATANKHISALRQVLETCWALGLLDADPKNRAVAALTNVRGARTPAGRALAFEEVDALLSTCDDGTPKGTRDAAMLAVMYATGLRRSEVVALDLTHWAPADRTFRVHGKGNKERVVPLAAEAVPWLMRWLAVREWSAGSLFRPVLKSGRVVERRLTAQTVRDVVVARASAAAIDRPSPHDFRRTVIGDLLDSGADLSTVQKFAGHASPQTTSGYDRRGDRVMRDAVDRLTVRQPRAAS